MKLKDCLEKIIDNRGRNPKYYDKEVYPVIDNVMIKNNYHPNISEATRFIDQDTHDNFLRGYLEPNLPIMTLVGGGIGNVSLSVDDKSVIVQNTIGFKTKENVLDSVYLYYWFLYKHDELIQFNRGSGQPSIRKTDVENMDIELKNISYQKKVSKILSNIDEKIELNAKVNNNLYEFTNKLFEEKILNNKDKDNWKEYVLSDISKVINGYSYKGNELIDKSDIGMTTIKNFERTGGFKLDGFKDIIPKKCKIDHYVKPFEVLVACTDLTQNADIIGNAIMLLNNSDYKEVIMSMDLVKLVPTTKFVNNYMLYAIVNSKKFKDFALGYKSGTSVLHLNKNCFKEYTIKLPSEDLLKDLSRVIEINYKKISQIIEENKKLQQLRDALLPKLMNGEIDLDNVEI